MTDLVPELAALAKDRLRQAIAANCTFTSAESVDQFESLLQQRPWDLMICDYMLTPVSTLDLLQITRQYQPVTPVIMIGQPATIREAVDLMRLGVRNIIEPSDPERLIDCLQDELSLKPSDSGGVQRSPERQLKQILDSMQDVIVSMSLPDRRLIYVSASFEQVIGYPAQRFMDDPDFFRQILHPEDAERVLIARQNILQEQFTTLDHRIIWADGQVRWVHRCIYVIFDAEHHPIQFIETISDITKQKQAEETLGAVSRQQRAILDAIPDLMFQIRADGTILDFHGAVENVVIPLDQLLGKNIRHFIDVPVIPTDVVQQTIETLQQASTLGKPLIFEYTMPDQRQYEARMIPIADSNELIIMARDITERKQSESRLRESEERYRSLVESIDSAIILLNEQGTILYSNDTAGRPFGFSASQMVGKTPYDLFPPQLAESQLADIRTTIQMGTGMVRESIDTLDGAERWFRTSIQPVRDSTGSFSSALVNATDITIIKESEASARRSEAYLRSLVNSETTFNLRVNLKGTISYCNERYHRQFGWASPSLIGMNPLELVHPEDHRKVYEAVAECFADTSKTKQIEIRKRNQAGDYLWTLWEFSAVSGSAGEVTEVHCVGFDITRQKQAEASLQEANQLLEQRIQERTAELQEERNLLRTVIDVIPDFIYVKDRQHRLILSNAAHIHSLGMHSSGDLLGKTDLDLFPPEMALQFHADEDRLFESEQAIIGLEEHHVRPDGGDAFMLTTKVLLRNTQGAITGMVGITRDITAMKMADRILRESEERYRLLAEHIKDFVAKMSPDGIVSYASPSSFTLLGYRPEEMIGRNAFEYVHPEDALRTRDILDQAIADGNDSLLITQRMLHKAGHLVWVEVSTQIVRDNEGQPFEVTGILRDVSERKQAENMLRASEERYRATMASMSEGVVVQNVDGTIELCNKAAERILGLTLDQMLGRSSIDPRWRSIHEDGSPFPGETHPAMVTLRTGEPQSNVIMGVHMPDGNLTWILINSQPLINPDDQQRYAVVVTFSDITVPKMAEEALKNALAKEKELGELKTRFVSIASHEFRTPLASILATTETLTQYWERLDKAKIDHRLNRIRQQVNHLTATINDVLHMSRMQSGRMKFEPVPGDLDRLCGEVIHELADLPDYHDRIRYECLLAPTRMMFDEALMRQVMNNLIHNALKYSSPETTVQVTIRPIENQIAISVADEGIGIPPEDLKHLFEPFHRAANVGDISGTGLGLSIVKQAVEMHGGTISVESQVNVGTTFTIRLPFRSKVNRP